MMDDDGVIPELSADQLRALLPALGHQNIGDHEMGPVPKGRILRLRLGMNPNSSSVGTNTVVFMWTLVSCAAVFSMVAGILMARFLPAGEDNG